MRFKVGDLLKNTDSPYVFKVVRIPGKEIPAKMYNITEKYDYEGTNLFSPKWDFATEKDVSDAIALKIKG